MSEIKMSYIVIEKEKHNSKTIQELLLEIIDSIAETRDERTISIDGVNISYHSIQKKNSKRCYLEMTSKERVSHSVPVLQKLDKAFFHLSSRNTFTLFEIMMEYQKAFVKSYIQNMLNLRGK